MSLATRPKVSLKFLIVVKYFYEKAPMINRFKKKIGRFGLGWRSPKAAQKPGWGPALPPGSPGVWGDSTGKQWLPHIL